jgi:hypothetical protein
MAPWWRTHREPGESARSVIAVPETLTARADVPTESPERYAKQLVSHLGRRIEWTTEGATSTAAIAGGTGVVQVGDGVLVLRAEAPDAETLDRVQDVLGRHLERFGRRNELTVVWTAERPAS